MMVSYNSRLDKNVSVNCDFSAVTLINLKQNHIQLVCEFISLGEYEIHIAEFGGGKNSIANRGIVNIKNMTTKTLIYKEKSKTWRVAKQKFDLMWRSIEDEKYIPSAFPVFFQDVGRSSMFVQKKIDYQTNDPEIMAIKIEQPEVFKKLCEESLSKYNPKKIAKNYSICASPSFWSSGFRILAGLNYSGVANKLIAAYSVLGRISNMFKSNKIKKVSVKTHNCGTWTFEKLQMADVPVKKPAWHWVAWGPHEYIKANK